jgi:tetratricopeptide (TPR) repeat protein
LLTFCSTLFELKRNDLASAIFFDHNLFDLAKKDSVRLSYFMLPLLSGVTFSRTMKLLNAHLLAEPQNNNFLEAIINMIILPGRDDYDDGQLLLVEDFLLLSLKLAEETGSGFVIGTACYNLANFYRGIGSNENALKYYMETRRHKPGYKLYDYYYEEIAGVLFLLGKFYLAEILYRKAIELNGGTGMTKALLADCLIYQGKYEQAISTLDVFLTEQHDKNEYLDEWYLKFSCLGTLLANGYPNSQPRNIAEGEALVIAGKNYEALQADMLNGQAWYLKGLDDATNRDGSSAFFDFAMAGLINVRSVDSWINATILCLDEKIGNSLLDYVVKTAYFYNGQNFLAEFFRVINNHPNADKIVEAFEKILPSTPERPMFIRFFSGDDEFETLSLTK